LACRLSNFLLFRAMIPFRHVHTLPHFLSKCSLHHMSVADRPGHIPARPALQAWTPAGPARPAGLDSGHLPARPALPAWLCVTLYLKHGLPQTGLKGACTVHTPGNQEGWGRCCCVPGVPRAYCSSNYPLSLEIYV
jgi:hypothetical protein